jgi:hypothetical protein
MTEDRITQRTVTVVMVVIAALAFVFSFGNVWSLALRLGVPAPIAAGHYGRAAVDAVAPLLLLGWGTVGPQLLRHFHIVTTTDTTPAPAPAAVATTPVPAPTPAVANTEPVPAPAPVPATPAPAVPAVKVPEPLLNEARSIAESHQATHGQPITVPQLKARLGVGLPMATAAHAALSA